MLIINVLLALLEYLQKRSEQKRAELQEAQKSVIVIDIHIDNNNR